MPKTQGPRGRVPEKRHKGPEHKSAPNAKKRKLVIAFDPDARKEYLTGFSKRKTERRKYGLAMGELKARKERLEERKDARESKKEQQAEGKAPLESKCSRPRHGRRHHAQTYLRLVAPILQTIPQEMERHLSILKEQEEEASSRTRRMRPQEQAGRG